MVVSGLERVKYSLSEGEKGSDGICCEWRAVLRLSLCGCNSVCAVPGVTRHPAWYALVAPTSDPSGM